MDIVYIMVDISLPKSVKSVNEQNAPKFYCACCDYTASKKHHLRKHLCTALHKRRQEATPKVKKCKCSFCFKTFKSKLYNYPVLNYFYISR